MASTEIKKGSLLAIVSVFLIAGISLGMGLTDYLWVRELWEKGWAQIPEWREVMRVRNDRAWRQIVIGIIGVSLGSVILVYVVMKPQVMAKLKTRALLFRKTG